MRNLFLIFCVVVYFPTFGQTLLQGVITDEQDSIGLPFVSIVLYKYETNTIVDYTQTNEKGRYSIELPYQVGIYTLKSRRLGYFPYTRDIVIGEENSKIIPLSFSLKADVEELKEVVVRQKSPIIVKEDTIIYDIDHWKEVRDQTLEDVLAKIPGFKILGDGEIIVNGKLINKIVINGEELANNGASLITKSLSPEDISSIELRTNEKDNKLKESLLDANEFVVLDIKLKEDLNKSLFGKMQTSLAYQENLLPGIYGNLFSLKKKIKVQLFAESDRLGNENISIDQIKYLGDEAVAKWFSEPADFDEFFNSPAIQEEIYGFKDFTLKENDIIGLTTRTSITPHFDIYFGSYNARNKLKNKRQYTQQFENGSSDQFQENLSTHDLISKNKIDFRFDKGKIKSSLNLNGVFQNTRFNSLNREIAQSTKYNFDNEKLSAAIYNNFLFESDLGSGFGVQLKATYSYLDTEQMKGLRHNNNSYGNYFYNEKGDTVFKINQLVNSTTENFVIDAFAQNISKLGVWKIGSKYQNNTQQLSKLAYQAESEGIIPLFSAPTGTLNFSKIVPYISHQYRYRNFNFQNELGIAYTSFPMSIDERKKNEQILEYKASMNYNGSNFNHFMISWEKRLSPFPLARLFPGFNLIDFQTIEIPGRNKLNPVPEFVGSMLFGVNFNSIGLRLDPSFYYGRSQNSNRFLFSASPFIDIGYDQLESEYLSASMVFIQEFKKLPLDIRWEPEWLINRTTNIDESGISYSTYTNIPSIGLKIRSIFEESFFNFNLYPKYTSFNFSNDLQEAISSQEMLSLSLLSKFDLFKDNLLLTTNFRAVQFLGSVQSEFLNTGFKIEYPREKFRWAIVADNIFNNKEFVKQSIFPTFFVSEQTAVFSRFIQLSLEYKFR